MKSFVLPGLLIAVLCCGSAQAQTGVLGKDWALQHPQPTAENLTGIAVNGTSTMVAVGGHGTILTAAAVSGTSSWTLNTSGTTADLSAVAFTTYNPTSTTTVSEYVAVGAKGTVLTSSSALTATGFTWTAQASGTVATDQLNAIVSNGANLVVVGATSTNVAVALVSQNGGLDWTRSVISGVGPLKSVTYNGSSYLAVGDNVLVGSASGSSWSVLSGLPATTVTSISFGSTASTSSVLNITGSKNWIAANGGAITTGSAPANLAVTFVGGEFAGVTNTGQLWHSANGILWQNLITPTTGTTTTTAIPAYEFNAVTKFGSTYVAVGESGVIQAYAVGGAWVAQTSAGTSLTSNSLAWNQLPGTNSLYVAVGWGMSWTSPDAVTWTEHAQSGLNMLSVIWTGTYFVSVGNGLWVSSDGINWTQKQPPPTSTGSAPSVFAVSWLNGNPYALGYNETTHQVMFSGGDNTGFGWSSFAAISGANWAMLGIARSDAGLFVAAGWGGRVLTSSMPATGVWKQTIVPLASGEDFTDIIWTNDSERAVKQFTAVTSKGGIWTSTNGTTWVKRKTASQALWCITRTDNTRTGTASVDSDDQFIAAGDHGLIVTSFNGFEWQEADMGTSQFINQILWAPATTTTTTTSTVTTVSINVTTAATTDPTTGDPVNGSADTTTTTVATPTKTLTIATNPPTVVSTVGTPVTNTNTVTGTTTITTAGQQTPTSTTATATVPGPDPNTIQQLVAAGGQGAFLVSNGTPPSQPVVSFGQSTDSITEGGPDATGLPADSIATVVVKISAAQPTAITVPLTFGGTALASTYKRSATSVTFPANDATQKTITITAVDDAIDHHNASVVVGFGTPSADINISSGASPTETITIKDNETAPVVTATVSTAAASNASSALVFTGTAVTLNSSTTGTGTISLQWQKNGVNIPGATQAAYQIPAASISSAGGYTVVGKSTAGTGTSATVQVGVVDGSNQSITAKANATVTLKVSTSGNGLTYLWKNTAGALSNGALGGATLSGTTLATLTMVKVNSLLNDTYTCTVSAGGLTLGSGSFALAVVAAAPTLSTSSFTTLVNGRIILQAGAVAVPYAVNPSVTLANPPAPASRWIITGLPPGLTYNTSTGAISGEPTRAGVYPVTVTASNVVGSSTRLTTSISISALSASLVGNFVATAAADASNSSLGGRLNLTTTSIGTFTGTYADVTGSTRFSGTLGGSGAASPDRTGTVLLSSKTVSFTLAGATGNVGGTVGTVALTGWHQTAANAHRTGYYTCGLNPSPVTTVGSGYAMLTVISSGAVSLTAVPPAGGGTKTTVSTIIGPNGDMPLYIPVTFTAGSVLGSLLLTENSATSYANNTITGTLAVPTTGDSNSTSLHADGGRYTAPAKGARVMNLGAGTGGGNLSVSFTGADLASDSRDPDGLFTVGTASPATPPASNPAQTFFQFVASTGEFSGTFALFDTVSRTGQFFGVFIRPSGSSAMTGDGFFYFPALAPATGQLFGTVNLAAH